MKRKCNGFTCIPTNRPNSIQKPITHATSPTSMSTPIEPGKRHTTRSSSTPTRTPQSKIARPFV
ncbi:hypothetical protein JAAARDRAFT_36880 [Jaapia argillacea MUCL 33604]|uniref:Uncharacterized protein n=1 Tax=Jaapia argillacea MUCL 33604 TaxID=933084 RepID=A0A067PQK4_9AGAM|nr:hypothetical protein JAAARDRAFT_36880 [Jaapia argillacea MUCL 33604]